MKFKITALAAVLLVSGNAYAVDSDAYYKIEILSSSSALPSGAKYGPYPSAISADGKVIAAHSYQSALSLDIDVVLPYTFNKPCQYSHEFCELEFHGSDNAGQLSQGNAYEKWRNDFISKTATQHLFSSFVPLTSSAQSKMPVEIAKDVDLKITAVLNNGSYVGYFNKLGKPEIRTAFYVDASGSYHKLEATGGNNQFNSVYDIKIINSKTIIVGTASIKENNYHDECYTGNYQDTYTKGDLAYCPGYNTKAYFWDVTDTKSGKLMGSWLSSESDNHNATALKINNQGISVGISSKDVSNNQNSNEPYNPQRAILMDISGKTLSDLTPHMDGTFYNTWAVSISDTKTVSDPAVIVGNREYAVPHARNEAVEFFIADSKLASISIPLADKKVMTTKHRGQNNSSSSANSRAYDSAMIAVDSTKPDGKKELWVIGEADDYNQNSPVTDNSPRGQTAFLYSKATNESWRINDLICPMTGGKVVCERVRVRSARVISDDGNIIIAEGFKYPTNEAFQYMYDAEHVIIKLTRNESVKTPNDSPNTWDSELYAHEDVPYERSSVFWSVFFLIPLMFIRRFKVKA